MIRLTVTNMRDTSLTKIVDISSWNIGELNKFLKVYQNHKLYMISMERVNEF
jgi:hypothetical protein